MNLVLDNKQCAFAPHVQVATLGSDLLLKNSDPILHTVHARLGKETLFNVGLPTWRQVTKRLDREGLIKIDCDVLICGDDTAACEIVVGLAKEIGLRGLYAGPICNSVAAEALTSILITINRRYKVPSSGIRITGILD